MIREFIWVGLGGAVGSMLRFGIGLWVRTGLLPWPTLLVNLTGSFLLGLLTALFLKHPFSTQPWRALLTAGFCGGFTTFSAFAMENLSFLQQGKTGLFFLYATGSIFSGLGAAWIGYILLK